MKIIISLLLIVFVYSAIEIDFPWPEPEPYSPGPFDPSEHTDLYDPVRITHAIMTLEEKYPNGYPWTNDNEYRWGWDAAYGLNRPWYLGYGCVAFAMMASDAAFGTTLPVYQFNDKKDIRVGDILRILKDTHSVIVLEDLGDNEYIVAEGNYGGAVHYGGIINIEVVGFDYGFTRYPQK